MPDVTFSFTDTQLDRLKVSIGKVIHTDGSPASNAEAKQWQITKWQAFVRQDDRGELESDVVMPSDIVVT